MILRRFLTVSRRETARVNRLLRTEFFSGILVIAAAVAGFAAANSPLVDAYESLRALRVGPAEWHLDLSLGTWASDGLLAVFFFMVGLELKREFVGGALRRPATAIVPVGAAFGGVLVPALIFLAFNAGNGTLRGWAIPTATDIAFAVTVLGLVAPRIPPMLRVFLLTLAVVDDFIAIAIIAIFYAEGLQLAWLAAAILPLGLYALLVQRRAAWFVSHPAAAWLILLPLGALVWVCVHASGLHATIAGVLLAFVVPVAAKAGRGGTRRNQEDPVDLAGSFSDRFGPLSSGLAVPVFAFFAAGVPISGVSGSGGSGGGFWSDPVAIGVILGLLLGKPLGIGVSTWVITRLTGTSLGGTARELIGVCCLGGIGFTVSLLIAELSFSAPEADVARLGVMVGSVASAVLAAVLLAGRGRRREHADH